MRCESLNKYNLIYEDVYNRCVCSLENTVVFIGVGEMQSIRFQERHPGILDIRRLSPGRRLHKFSKKSFLLG